MCIKTNDVKEVSALEAFTQSAYLHTSAVKNDSRIFESPELAYVESPSSDKRCFNAIVRATHKPEEFFRLKELVNTFDRKKLNFTWHSWASSSHPALSDYLKRELKLEFSITALLLYKNLSEVTSPESSEIEIVPLPKEDLVDFVTAKMAGWDNPSSTLTDLADAAQKSLKSEKHQTFVAKLRNKIVGAASSYTMNDKAYLRADFVIPEMRGKGIYKKLILHREQWLWKHGIRQAATITRPSSSGPIYQKLGYQTFSEIQIYARKKTPWISL